MSPTTRGTTGAMRIKAADKKAKAKKTTAKAKPAMAQPAPPERGKARFLRESGRNNQRQHRSGCAIVG